MRFITRLLSVSALGLVLGLATAGAASAHTDGGFPQGCQGGYSQSQCCQAPNWNQGPSQGNPWEGQNQCCQGEGHNSWGMGQSECCSSPGGVIGLFAAFNHGSNNCFQPLQCTFPGRHHKHHNHHKHHKHHKNWHQPGMFC